MTEFWGLTHAGQWRQLDWMLLVVGAWLAIGLAGVAALRRFTLVSRVLFPAGGVLGLALFGLALPAVFGGPQTVVLPVGLPTLPFHLRLDSLAAFFLMVIGAVGAGVSVFAATSTSTVAALLLPWLLNSLKLDPAFGSGPLATVVQDLLSIWIFLLVGCSVFTL